VTFVRARARQLGAHKLATWISELGPKASLSAVLTSATVLPCVGD